MPGISTISAATRGRLLLLAAAILWSTSGLLLKSPPLARLPNLESGPVLACYRALFAACLLLPFVRRAAIRWRPMLLPMVLAFALMNGLFVTAMTRTTAAAAIFLQYTSIVWAFVFGVVFLRERADRGNLFALICAVCGIGIIVADDWGGRHFVGNLFAMGAGLSYAGVIVCLRWLRDEDAVWLVALNHVFAGLILLPWALTLNVPLDASQWLLVALLGMLQMALPYVLFTHGIRHVRTQEAALLTLIEPILNPIWVWVFWQETVELSTWIGGGLILGGLAARYLLFANRSPSKQRCSQVVDDHGS